MQSFDRSLLKRIAVVMTFAIWIAILVIYSDRLASFTDASLRYYIS